MTPRAGLGLAAPVALLATLPAALRVAGQGGSFLLAWLLLAGGVALVVGPMLALARAVRPVPTALLGALAGALVAALPLLVLARLLHQHTNHRPLGAATFAVLALLLVAFFSLAGWRALVAWPGQSSRRLLILGGFTLVLSGLAALAASHAPWRASVTDGVVLITLCVAASVLRLSDDWSRRLSRLAAPSWLVLALVGGILSQATIGSVVGEAAPVLSPLNGW